MKSSRLGPGSKSIARNSTFRPPGETKGNGRRSSLKQGNGFAASKAQRDAVRGTVCVVCQSEYVEPAHLIDRSLGGDDDPLAVVGLCRAHHDLYDDHKISLLEHLEPYYREHLAYAVQLVGLITALERITNDTYVPEKAA